MKLDLLMSTSYGHLPRITSPLPEFAIREQAACRPPKRVHADITPRTQESRMCPDIVKQILAQLADELPSSGDVD